MYLCLRCFYVSPRESALCGRCGRGLGGRRCPKLHKSPPSALVCTRCGSPDLTQAAPCLPLTWLAQSLAAGLVMLGLRFLIGHFPLVFCATCRASAAIPAWLFQTTPMVVWNTCLRLVTWLALLWTFSHFLPGESGQKLRSAMGWALKGLWRLGSRVTSWLWRTLIAPRPVKKEQGQKP